MRCIAALLICLTPMVVHADDPNDQTAGAWWKGLTDVQKLWFVQGSAHGYNAGTSGTSLYLGHFRNGRNARGRPIGITYGTLVGGVDKCYLDFRNNNLDVEVCLDWTVRSVHGASEPTGEQFLEKMRAVYK